MIDRLKNLALSGALLLGIAVVIVSCGGTPEDMPVAERPAVAPAATATVVTPPTAAPQPSPTAVPTPSASTASQATAESVASAPTPTNPEVERLSERGMDLLTTFTEEYSPRESGTDGERAAAEFIGGYLEDLGYRVEYQPVEAEHIPWGDEFVSLAGDGRPELQAVPLSMTGFGDVTGPLVNVGKAFIDELPEDGLDGAIALIERGEITFEVKVNRVASAGAIAAIIFNSEQGNFRGALQSDGPIPVASLSRQQGRELARLLEEEPGLEARVNIQTVLLESQNVIAELGDQPEECGVVVLGGHYDSVADTEAAGDNGTGVVSLLVMAEELASAQYDEGEPLPYAVRLVFFGVEEIGLYGSKHYVDELNEDEREEISAMLNFDAMGKGRASMEGSDALADIAAEIADANNIALAARRIERGFGSDHASFLAVDIPALFFYGDDFSIINSPDDVLEEVDPLVMGTNMAVGLGMLRELECEPQG